MNIALARLLDNELNQSEIAEASIGDDNLIIDLSDGRTVIAPILWYPSLAYATDDERQNFEVRGNVIFWPGLDEEVSVRNILLGRKSGESLQSLQKWFGQRSCALVTN